MLYFLAELFEISGGGVFLILAILLLLFQLVVSGVAFFSKGRSFSRRWSTALALAVPVTLGLAMLAGMQLCRMLGLEAVAATSSDHKAMMLAQGVAGDIMIQLVGGSALLLSGLLSTIACGLSMRAGNDEARAPKPSFAGLGLLAGLGSLCFGGGLAWRAMDFLAISAGLANADPSQKMVMLGKGLQMMPCLVVPTALAIGLWVLGAIWTAQTHKRAGKSALVMGFLCFFMGAGLFAATRPHAKDGGEGLDHLLKFSTSAAAYRPDSLGQIDPPQIKADKALEPGPTLGIGRRKIFFAYQQIADLETEETQELERGMAEELNKQTEREEAMGLGKGRPVVLLLDKQAEGKYVARALSTLLKERNMVQLAIRQFEKIDSALYGPLSLTRWTALNIKLGSTGTELWPRDEEEGQAWATRLAKAAKDGTVEIAPPQAKPPAEEHVDQINVLKVPTSPK